jgi:osmotically-inducible protein OsmY
MKKVLTTACAVTILVALSARDASATYTTYSGRVKIAEAGHGQEVADPPSKKATGAKQPVEAPSEATDEMRGADGLVGELTDDTMITTKVKAALLQDPGTSALAIGVDTWIGGVRLTGSVDSVEKKQRAQDIAERVDGVIAVDNALSVK